MKCEKIIIIGASGLIGRYLLKHLKETGKEVIGTYNKNKKEGLVYFNLLNSSVKELLLKDVKYAIICSAIVKIDECKKNQEYSEKINVDSTQRIIKELSEKNIIPVFISGAVVFDGKGDYKEKDIRNPPNEYGRQKKKVEDFLIKNIKEFLIIRLGKVFGVNQEEGIFSEWIDKYKKNEEIPCIYDEKLSLTYAGDIAKGISILLEKNKRGIFHIDSGVHKSRFEFARDFFNYLGIKDVKIKKCSVSDFNFLEKRAKNQLLNSSKFLEETGFEFTPIEKCYEMIKLLKI